MNTQPPASPSPAGVLTEAASVLLARGPGSAEVLAVRRAEALRVFGGFLAFPGGKVSPADAAVLPADPRRATAARELFEETGVLLARRPDGSSLPSNPGLAYLRKELVEERLTFRELLRQLDLAVRAEDFAPAGTFRTPAFAPVRFDTRFYVADLPPGQEADVWPGELDSGFWATAADLLGRWTRGECLITPPTLVMLQAVRGRPVRDLAACLAPHFAALDAGALPPVPCSPDVDLIPLRTLALPPSTHTNAYLVGRDPAYLIDPGAADPDEQRRLFEVLDARVAEGRRLGAVVLTHHHPDHTGAVAACAGRYGLPVWAHPLTARALTGQVAVAREVNGGDKLELGPAPDGEGAWHLEALHTPGHAPGHLAFWEPRYRLLFAGDMVSTLSSVVVAPPDGDLTLFLDSLRRLRGLDSRLLLPAHGGPVGRPDRVIDESLAHRRKREAELLRALTVGGRKVADLAAELYKGLSPELVRFAELQVLAGLQKLQREGRVEASGRGPEQTWRLRP